MRVVLELAGVRNCFGKQLGSVNPLNNARATIEGLRALRTFKDVRCASRLRGTAASACEQTGRCSDSAAALPGFKCAGLSSTRWGLQVSKQRGISVQELMGTGAYH